MRTEKLYYQDCNLRKFTAKVLYCRACDKGWQVILDATGFYPEGGGQGCDLGSLGGVNVLDVQEIDGQLFHLCDGPLAEGSTVEGEIDWARRFDFMQQHTGEHIISGLIHSMLGHQNVGYHVGQEVVTADFDGPVTEAQLEEIQRRANEAVWENIPLRCYIPAKEELPSIFYRSKEDLVPPIRIVEIPGYDSCACCGIHVAHTGQVGLVKLLSCIKFHQGVRIEMVCGKRAMEFMNQVFDQNRQISQLLSARILETGEAVRHLQSQLEKEKIRAVGLQRQIYDQIAGGFAGKENAFYVRSGMAPGEVRELADRIAKNCAGVAVVASDNDGENFTLCMVSQNVDVRPMAKQAFAALQGRGGGKENAVQGTVRTNETILRRYFEEILKKI